LGDQAVPGWNGITIKKSWSSLPTLTTKKLGVPLGMTKKKKKPNHYSKRWKHGHMGEEKNKDKIGPVLIEAQRPGTQKRKTSRFTISHRRLGERRER